MTTNLLTQLPISVQTVGLLIGSNLFMTMAWYGHLKYQADKPWWVAALVSWESVGFGSGLRRGEFRCQPRRR